MEQEINEIISHNNTIQDPVLSEKIEILIQKQNNVTIPCIILENISKENENFELEDQKQFFNHFGEVLNIIITDKKSIVLFKTFFIANICKGFLQNENIYKDNKMENFNVRWFDFEKDENLLLQEIKPLFEDLHKKNIKNLKQNSSENKTINNQNNNNNRNNNIGINMSMNINNFNINTTMNNPMAQNPNMIGIQNMQYLQFLQLMKMNKSLQNNNIPPQGMPMMPNYNFNQINQMQLQQQNGINPLNMLMAKPKMNMNNNINQMNLQNNINNPFNNNIKNQLLNQNIQQMNNQHFNQNLHQNNFNQNANNNENNNNNDEKNFGKYTCKYQILIANDKDFQIARRLIGSKGCNMKNIINECKLSEDGEGIKLRLRGKGSGYKEGPQNKESDEPLHLCISSKNVEEMKKACLLVDELLDKISKDYKDYCQKNNVMPVNSQIAIRIDNKNSNNMKNNK